MRAAIIVNELSKKYQIAQSSKAGKTLRDFLARAINEKTNFFKIKSWGKLTDFWALNNINFSVKKGEVLGIIGPNGAGKSTLLKILSKIIPPTTGEVVINGRVASLLEVGTGFHPELSGRENIFLNGAILGMAKKEISKKFDKIVEFSGISKFIDTQVKRYSSGMSVRLAFSIAAHLEPDILLVDEVLAVGDVEFQKRSLGKMNEIVNQSGRTILFISHNMEAISSLCDRCLLINQGEILEIEKTEVAIQKYLNIFVKSYSTPIYKRKDRKGRGNIQFKYIKILNQDNSSVIKSGDKLKIIMYYNSIYKENIKEIRLSIILYNNINIPIFHLNNFLTKNTIKEIKPNGEITCLTDQVHLNEGMYSLNIAIFCKNIKEDQIFNAITFQINKDYKKYNFNKNFNSGANNLLIAHSFFQEDK